jgi:DNA-binding NtrC family response regulator
MFRAILIVEDSPHLTRSLATALGERAETVHCCETVQEARWSLAAVVPDLILLDFDLPDGNAFDVLRLLESVSPTPAVIGMSGVACPEDAFQLAEWGVMAYLRKPFDLARLGETLSTVVGRPPNIAPLVRRLVGHASIPAVERDVRAIMVNEALARSQGSRRGAAKLLAISRQMLQHILRREREA